MSAMRAGILVIIAVVGTALAVHFGQGYLPASWRTGDGKKTDVVPAQGQLGTVTALGRLEPITELVELGGPPGGRIDRFADKDQDGNPIKVEQGAKVKKGCPLVYLDNHDEMQAALEHAQATYQEAVERYDAESTYGDKLVIVAKLKSDEVDEVMPKQIEAQEAEVRRSEAELEKLKIDQQRAEQMLKDRAIAKSSLDTANLSVRQAEEQLAANRALLEKMKKDQIIKGAQTDAEIESATAAKKRAELSAQKSSLAQAVELAKARLERTMIRAPIDGEIIKIQTWPGESTGQQPILMLADTDHMVAIAEVYETDVHRVTVGQEATVTSKAFPEGTELKGKVDRINKLVHKKDVLKIDPTAYADARVIEVRIRLDDSSLASNYTFLQVDVSIGVPDEME